MVGGLGLGLGSGSGLGLTLTLTLTLALTPTLTLTLTLALALTRWARMCTADGRALRPEWARDYYINSSVAEDNAALG